MACSGWGAVSSVMPEYSRFLLRETSLFRQWFASFCSCPHPAHCVGSVHQNRGISLQGNASVTMPIVSYRSSIPPWTQHADLMPVSGTSAAIPQPKYAVRQGNCHGLCMALRNHGSARTRCRGKYGVYLYHCPHANKLSALYQSRLNDSLVRFSYR